MSTQHPDNVHLPFFAESAVLGGEDEIQEAYYVFSHLGCDEQMWDVEGKEVDSFVVKKLLSRYEAFFQDNRLGRDVFLTLRVPNPTVERAEAKVLLETLESIPRSFDAARLSYGGETAPVFQVILPMTTSHRCLNRVYNYYRDFVIGKQHKSFNHEDITIAEWIGEFAPASIDVIPLFEDMPRMLAAADIVREYMRGKDLPYQRVFLARSDPAMNYGVLSAVLLNKIALQRLAALSDELSIPFYPIIGVGSAPFRGNMRPATVEGVLREYPSVHTFTVQSSFKYDNPPDDVKQAVDKLKAHEAGRPHEVDAERCIELMDRYSAEYQRQVVALAPLIQRVSKFVPSRRKRKLHIGLFGYSRAMEGVALPRAISFTAALYSVGVPPEILGLNALTPADVEFLRSTYHGWEEDRRDAFRFYNPDSPFVPEELRPAANAWAEEVEGNTEHHQLTQYIGENVSNSDTTYLGERLLAAANLRNFLG